MRYVFNANEVVRYRYPTHTNDLLYGREDASATETFIVVLEPGEAPPLHIHRDTEQVFYVIAGAGELQVGEGAGAETLRMKVGDVVRIPPATWHTVCNTGAEPMRYLSVDAFAEGRPAAEPTWDSHVQVLCAEQGWDFDAVRQRT
jgi:mannose-6-phosphate isomerase-like protein (cupin superfamily)